MTSIMKRCARRLALLIVPAMTVACHDAYDALFLDPEKSTTAKIEYLFTQGLVNADFPIAYGEGADTGALQRIAEATGGQWFDASDPAKIDLVFASVINNF